MYPIFGGGLGSGLGLRGELVNFLSYEFYSYLATILSLDFERTFELIFRGAFLFP